MTGRLALVVEIQNRACAVPLAHVIETLRPLPIEAISGIPQFIKGVSVIRGLATPVVDLGVLLGAPGIAARFVTLRLGDRQVALSVGNVLGVRELNATVVSQLPPLLKAASQDFIETISTLDGRMLVVLRESWELPSEVWQAVAVHESRYERNTRAS